MYVWTDRSMNKRNNVSMDTFDTIYIKKKFTRLLFGFLSNLCCNKFVVHHDDFLLMKLIELLLYIFLYSYIIIVIII